MHIKDAKDIIKNKCGFEKTLFYLFILTSIGLFVLSGINYIGFAKHFVIIAPILAIMIARDIGKYAEFFKGKKLVLTLLAALISINYFLIFVGDPIFTPDVWLVFSQFNFSIILSIFGKILLMLLPLLWLFFFIFLFR